MTGRPRVPRSAVVLGLSMMVGLSACEFDAGTAPAITPRLVVHGVLNPYARDAVILVEQTRAGQSLPSLGVADGDSLEPIAGRGGLPVRGAAVVVFTPAGDSAVALEDATTRDDGRGQGVYRIRNAWRIGAAASGAPDAVNIVPGQRFRLRVSAPPDTPLGVATAETVVPNAPGLQPDSCTTRLDIFQGGTGQVAAGASIEPAGGYVTQVEGRFGSVVHFTNVPPIVSAGGRGPFVYVRTFQPDGGTTLQAIAPLLPAGFRQTAAVAVVDSNYRNYYQGQLEDPFGSESRASSIRGGVGLFGSTVLLAARVYDLYSTAGEEIVGRWVPDVPSPVLPDTVDLYVRDSWNAFAQGPYPFSGRYKFKDGRQGGVTGTADIASGTTPVHITLHDGRGATSLDRPIATLPVGSYDGQTRITMGSGTSQVIYRRIANPPPRPSAGTCR